MSIWTRTCNDDCLEGGSNPRIFKTTLNSAFNFELQAFFYDILNGTVPINPRPFRLESKYPTEIQPAAGGGSPYGPGPVIRSGAVYTENRTISILFFRRDPVLPSIICLSGPNRS
jgi:hypothetical protein